MFRSLALALVVLLTACVAADMGGPPLNAAAARPYGEGGVLIDLSSTVQDTVFAVGGRMVSATSPSVGGVPVGRPGMHVTALVPAEKFTEGPQGLLISARPPCYREKTKWVSNVVGDRWATTFVFTDLDLVSNGQDCMAGATPLPADAGTDRRVALVIGNGNYYQGADGSGVRPLNGPVADANLVASTLRSLGFALVGGGAVTNVTKARFAEAVRALDRRSRNADIVLFYYAGHGVQIDHHNWLLPVDYAHFEADTYRTDLIDADEVVTAMGGAAGRIRVLILDACRDNPFPGLPGGGPGLAGMQMPPNTVIAFASSPGTTAGDGIYAPRLIKAMTTPHLDLPDVFRQAAVAVERQGQGQVPAVHSSLPPSHHFYLVP